MEINELKFNKDTPANLRKIKYGFEWPAVYIINNQKEVYIGETTDASSRMKKHLANIARKDLKNLTIISDETFNKSVILDLECFLIQYMAADKRFKLQNGNNGLRNHNYYQREMYKKEFKDIWKQLMKRGLAKKYLGNIENTNLFKYSPYKALSIDQYSIIDNLLNVLEKDIKNNTSSTFLLHGGAGTGKTILAMYLIKLILDLKDKKQEELEEDKEQNIINTLSNNNTFKDWKIGLVIPTDNFRAAIKKVFNDVNGLNPSMVLSPNDVAKNGVTYDLLIVDEAHRLRQRVNLTQYHTFDLNNKKLNLDKDGTELDWILKKSKYQVLFYDEYQRIKPTDVKKEDFDKLQLKENCHTYYLETQFRCMLGGKEYVEYIRKIFSNDPPTRKKTFKKYDFKLFENINDMVENIQQKNEEYGLCRNVAGYAWPWKTKGKLPKNVTKEDIEKSIKNDIYDIEIEGYKYIWNVKNRDWINSQNAINEIGSIHTTQGFDLNYTGLIIGNDLKYDDVNKKIIVDRKSYCDVKGKSTTNDEELLQFLLNIYGTMCTRGILGTYIYVCDKKLRQYLKKYIDVIK